MLAVKEIEIPVLKELPMVFSLSEQLRVDLLGFFDYNIWEVTIKVEETTKNEKNKYTS